MKKSLKILIAVAGFAAFMLIVWLMYTNLSQKYQEKTPWTRVPVAENSESPKPGKSSGSETPVPSETTKVAAPDFTVYDANGNKVKLSDYKGTPVVMNFWASWCPPCKSEMPEFNKVSGEYKSDQLVFLMVDMVDGSRETADTGKKFIEDNQYTFNVLYDSDQDAANTYGVNSIPRTFFIDRDGNIQAWVEGAIDEKTLRNGITLIDSPK